MRVPEAFLGALILDLFLNLLLYAAEAPEVDNASEEDGHIIEELDDAHQQLWHEDEKVRLGFDEVGYRAHSAEDAGGTPSLLVEEGFFLEFPAVQRVVVVKSGVILEVQNDLCRDDDDVDADVDEQTLRCSLRPMHSFLVTLGLQVVEGEDNPNDDDMEYEEAHAGYCCAER